MGCVLFKGAKGREAEMSLQRSCMQHTQTHMKHSPQGKVRCRKERACGWDSVDKERQRGPGQERAEEDGAENAQEEA